MTKLRPIGTCEHLWSPWRLLVTFAADGSPRIDAERAYGRICELCWGRQFAANVAGIAEREQAALVEKLPGNLEAGPRPASKPRRRRRET